jgi:hypothetical protein
MRHPAEGVLRRLLDEPVAVPDDERAHVHRCPRCRADLDAMRQDAALVGAALVTASAVEPDLDLDAAWSRLSSSEPAVAPAVAPPPVVVPATPLSVRLRTAVRRPLVAALAVVAVLAGAGTAAANDWFEIFRTEAVAPIEVSATDLLGLPDLSAFGEVELTGDADLRTVPDATTAAAVTGLAVPRPSSLPRGVGGQPEHRVTGEVTATLTFSAERAAAAAAEAGTVLPPPPAGLDGSRISLGAGPGVALTWSEGGAPSLLVARAVAPTAHSDAIPFDAVRDYLLSLPWLSNDLAAQLRAFGDGSTLPVPVPVDRVRSSSVEIGGRPATLLTARDRLVAAVVWVEDGAVTVVAGPLDGDEVVSVARGLA